MLIGVNLQLQGATKADDVFTHFSFSCSSFFLDALSYTLPASNSILSNFKICHTLQFYYCSTSSKGPEKRNICPDKVKRITFYTLIEIMQGNLW